MGEECPAEKQHPNISVGLVPSRQCKQSTGPKEMDGKAATRGTTNQCKDYKKGSALPGEILRVLESER